VLIENPVGGSLRRFVGKEVVGEVAADAIGGKGKRVAGRNEKCGGLQVGKLRTDDTGPEKKGVGG